MFDYPKLTYTLSERLTRLILQRVRVRIENLRAPMVVIYVGTDRFVLQDDEAAELIATADILKETYE